MPINYAYPDGQVRLLVGDVDEDNLLLTDDQVHGFLTMHGVPADAAEAPVAAIRRAAADALDTIASSEALVSKKIRSQDLSTDGPAVAAALRAHAVQLRVLADAADDDDVDPVAVLEFAPHPHRVWP
nr:hypothetical protein [uncultured Actinotalea sp.]